MIGEDEVQSGDIGELQVVEGSIQEEAVLRIVD
jgi:hypothetical protein